MRTLNRRLGFIIFQIFIKTVTRSYSARFSGNLLRLFSGNHDLPGGPTTQMARPAASRRQGSVVDWPLMALCLAVLLPMLAACTRNIGGENDGWNPPASIDGVVYVGTKDGEVKALTDDGSGNLQATWTFPSSSSEDELQGMYNTPLVVGDLVYVSGINGYLYALDKESGRLTDGGWRKPQGQFEDPEPLVAGPAYDPLNDLVLAPSEDGNLYAYAAKSGDQAWSPFQTGGAIWSTPAVENGIGYFGSHDHKVYAVSLNDGKELWQYETDGVVAGKPLVFDGMVIAGSFDKKLYAISVGGNLAWTFEGDNWFWAGAVTDGSTIFAPNMDGNIYALDRNGNLLWKHDVGSSIVSSPVLVPRGLVVAAKDGNLLLLETGSAGFGSPRVLFNQKIGDAEIKAPLFAEGDSVYVGSQDRTVRRIEFRGGQRNVWCLHTRDGFCN